MIMNVLRIVFLTLLVIAVQIWVLAPLLVLGEATVWFYPVVLSFLPMSVRRVPLLWIGFALGAVIDMLMLMPGLHAAAMTFVALMRYYILVPMIDKNMNLQASPSYAVLGGGAIVMLAILMLLHHVLLYALDAGFHFDTYNLLWRFAIGYVSSLAVATLTLLTFSVRLEPR